MSKVKALVTTGHGINCENETRYALEIAGFDQIDLIHLNFLAKNKTDFKKYNIIVFPGGFLDGDDLGSAQACVNRIRHSKVDGRALIELLLDFIETGGLVLGICNGFQLLVKLGLLPALDNDYSRRTFSLTANDSGRFENRWVHLTVDETSECVFTKNLQSLFLPVRHGEGKLIAMSQDLPDRLVHTGQAALRYIQPETGLVTSEYPFNPNGSVMGIAGICDPSGRVFGLMPHPECYVHRTQHPQWTRMDLPEEGDGLALFKNARKYWS